MNPTRSIEELLQQPIEAIIPHRGTMLLIDAVSAFSEETLSARATVHAGAWYADAQGAMPAWIGIELMAQAIAARGAQLLIHVTELLRSEEGHGAYECTIHDGDMMCAEAVIKVFQPSNFQSFIEGSFSS
ncbi:MAG: 3-hydroxydecanoyl-[ACP] dehydratase (EC [uncultured Paraburkholderia sp.]|nr:MAG: 3-hydroxydecanoyl-[ACP] dehydratase (EC [uncultured Paraburkholderia sp.]